MNLDKVRRFYSDIYTFLRNIGWLRLTVNYFIQLLKEIYERFCVLAAIRKVSGRWKHHVPSRSHVLPGELIVSLTSYPARFDTLHLTLKCLLTQSIAPDRLILWIAYQDKSLLTDDILNLKSSGLEILFCDDLRSFKKIIPTLQIAPEAFIVTADDDTYYWPTWLEELVIAYSGNNKEILCHRAHKIHLNESGMPLPYKEWEYDIEAGKASLFNFPTGIGGILYPPSIFFTDVLEIELFMSLCPNADDIWLYWMVRLNGGKARKIGKKQKLITWAGSQNCALGIGNFSHDGNDIQLRSMLFRYGFPMI